MSAYFIRRILWLIPVLITVSLVTFIIMHSAPGGPWDTSEERRQVDASTQKSLDAYYGLDKPLWRQFTAYVFGDTNSKTGKFACGLICGNLGPSYRQRGRTVQDILFSPPVDKTFWESRFGGRYSRISRKPPPQPCSSYCYYSLCRRKSVASLYP